MTRTWPASGSAAPRTAGAGTTVGFVGIGRMGLPMSRRLVDAGYAVRAFDTDADARETFAQATGTSPCGALRDIAGAAVVVLMLPDSSVVDRVMLDDGLLDAVAAGTVIVDMGSSEPSRTRELAGRARERGAWLMDAPVSGGVAGAEAGSLTIMAGGEPAVVGACRPLLDVLGDTVVHVGPAGAGHALKALNNLLSATHLLASAEAMEIGRRFGLDAEVMLDAINASTGRSWSTQHKLPRFVVTERYDSGFALALMLKDMRTAARLAEELGIAARMLAPAVLAWEDAAGALPERADHTEIARWVQESSADAQHRHAEERS